MTRIERLAGERYKFVCILRDLFNSGPSVWIPAYSDLQFGFGGLCVLFRGLDFTAELLTMVTLEKPPRTVGLTPCLPVTSLQHALKLLS